MKKLFLFLVVILCYSCTEGNKTFENQVKSDNSLQSNIIGKWKIDQMYAGIDTANTLDFPDINLETGISFYSNDSYKINNKPTSDYKVKGDTLFIYEPVVKHWYALYATINSNNKLEISSRKGYSHLDMHYLFGKVAK